MGNRLSPIHVVHALTQGSMQGKWHDPNTMCLTTAIYITRSAGFYLLFHFRWEMLVTHHCCTSTACPSWRQVFSCKKRLTASQLKFSPTMLSVFRDAWSPEVCIISSYVLVCYSVYKISLGSQIGFGIPRCFDLLAYSTNSCNGYTLSVTVESHPQTT